uniref:Uncharacterized protein n=1 Tax=Octopus bimaculoides TaxID=37653 RepID=A0A0L8FRI3_OCTBM
MKKSFDDVHDLPNVISSYISERCENNGVKSRYCRTKKINIMNKLSNLEFSKMKEH